MRTLAYIAIVLLIASFVETKRKSKQCTGKDGENYDVGDGYENECQKYTCRRKKSNKNKSKMVQTSSKNCCKYQGKDYNIGEVITSQKINQCSEKVNKCGSFEGKGTMMFETTQEHCCHYKGETLAPGERLPLAQKCAYITCVKDSQSASLSVEVQYPGAYCCLAEDGSMHPEMAEIVMKLNASDKLVSCCKGYWVHFPITGNHSQQHCSAGFDPLTSPDTIKKRTAITATRGHNWMKMVDGTKTLNLLSIPGTHDTMAWKSEIVISLFSNTQSLTLYEQLNHGVRYLDIRLRYRNGYLGCYHDWVYVHNYFQWGVMDPIKRFLSENPSETVIFRYWNTGESSQHGVFCSRFNSVLQLYKPYIWRENYSQKLHYQSNTPTLHEVRGKIVIINEKENQKCFGFKFQELVLDNYEGKGSHPITKNSFAPIVSVNGRSFQQKMSSFVKMEAIEEDESEYHMMMPGNKRNMNNQTISDIISTITKENTDQTKDTEHETIDLSNIPTLDEFQQFKDNQTSIIGPEQEKNRLFFIVGAVVVGVVVAAGATYGVLNAVYDPSEAYKRELEAFLDVARTNYDDKNKYLMVTFASAVDWKCNPKRVASHVNPRINNYFKNNPSGSVGIVAFDYITNWNGDLPKNIYSRNFRDSPAKYLEVSSNGEARQFHGARMGKYKLQPSHISRNNFPVWKNEAREQYIIVDDNGYWGISNAWNSNSVGICNGQNNPTPQIPVFESGWFYYHDGWKSDDTLTVEPIIEGSIWIQRSDKDCWGACRDKGLCPSVCGVGGYCCREGYDGCPPQAAKASPKHHTCVVNSNGE